jgi:hypothetical protein
MSNSILGLDFHKTLYGVALHFRTGRGRKRKLPPDTDEEIYSMIKSNPNITIDELKIKI